MWKTKHLHVHTSYFAQENRTELQCSARLLPADETKRLCTLTTKPYIKPAKQFLSFVEMNKLCLCVSTNTHKQYKHTQHHLEHWWYQWKTVYSSFSCGQDKAVCKKLTCSKHTLVSTCVKYKCVFWTKHTVNTIQLYWSQLLCTPVSLCTSPHLCLPLAYLLVSDLSVNS